MEQTEAVKETVVMKPKTVKKAVKKKIEPKIKEDEVYEKDYEEALVELDVQKEEKENNKLKGNPVLQKSYRDGNDYIINLFAQGDKYCITTSDNKEFVDIDDELAKEIMDKADGYYNLRGII